MQIGRALLRARHGHRPVDPYLAADHAASRSRAPPAAARPVRGPCGCRGARRSASRAHRRHAASGSAGRGYRPRPPWRASWCAARGHRPRRPPAATAGTAGAVRPGPSPGRMMAARRPRPAARAAARGTPGRPCPRRRSGAPDRRGRRPESPGARGDRSCRAAYVGCQAAGAPPVTGACPVAGAPRRALGSHPAPLCALGRLLS